MTIGLMLAAAMVALVIGAWLSSYWNLGRTWRVRTPEFVPLAVRGRVMVNIEAPDADPKSEAVHRLVRETALHILVSVPDAEEVEVRSQHGALLGVWGRTAAPRSISLPRELSEPHRLHHPGPHLEDHMAEDEPILGRPEPRVAATSTVEAEFIEPPSQPVADRFDLPESVSTRLAQRDDAVELVRAILAEGGCSPVVQEDIILAGGHAIFVLPERHGATVQRSDLDHAYLRIKSSGAERGLVLTLGRFDCREVRRREELDPGVGHDGPAAIQRMADAVAIGADPLRFSRGPALAPRFGQVAARRSTGPTADAARSKEVATDDQDRSQEGSQAPVRGRT